MVLPRELRKYSPTAPSLSGFAVPGIRGRTLPTVSGADPQRICASHAGAQGSGGCGRGYCRTASEPTPEPSASMFPHARAHYRVRFPDPERPVFIAGDRETHEVVDCSENGLRFRPAPHVNALPEVGTRARGRIRFRSGRVAEVAGVVVRIQDEEVAVHLDEAGIPFYTVIHEQLLLRKKYPSGGTPVVASAQSA